MQAKESTCTLFVQYYYVWNLVYIEQRNLEDILSHLAQEISVVPVNKTNHAGGMSWVAYRISPCSTLKKLDLKKYMIYNRYMMKFMMQVLTFRQITDIWDKKKKVTSVCFLNCWLDTL